MREKQFENKIKAFLKTIPNIWFYKHWAGAYSQSGIPDIIACINGKFVAIEVKREKGVASELQKRNIKLINDAKGIGIILYPKDFEKFKQKMRELAEDD